MKMKFGDAIDLAVEHAMLADERVVVLGEDVHTLRATLYARFGDRRVIPAPISEAAFLGAAAGAAMAGLRPIAEVMLVDFIGVAFDALLNHAARVETFSGGAWTCPLVVRCACGGGYGDGGQHEQALWGLLGGIAGLRVVVPSTPGDAYGLMAAAIGDPGPVVFLEHKLLSELWPDAMGGASRSTVSFDVPEDGAVGEVVEGTQVELGVANLRRTGDDLTLVSLGVGVHRCLEAAQQLANDGVACDVIDLRCVRPLDRDAVVESVRRTGKVIVVDEDYRELGLSGELAAVLAEAGVHAGYRRVCTDSAIPYAPRLELRALPNVERIVAAARELLDGS